MTLRPTADEMVDALRARGVLVGDPTRRIELVEDAIEGGVADPEWSEVLGYLDDRYAGNPGLLGGVLVKVLSGEAEWQDAVECAKAARQHRPASTYPDHYRAGDPPGGACVHGVPGSKWCDDCASVAHAARSGHSIGQGSRKSTGGRIAAARRTAAQERIEREGESGTAAVRVLCWLAVAAVSMGGLYGLAGAPAVAWALAWTVGMAGAGCALADDGAERRRAGR